MIITDRGGNKAQAFDLIMQKKFAYQILKGEKKMEFRSFSAHYQKRFWDYDAKAKEFKDKDIFFIHFHDYNQTWFLDVQIEAVDMMMLLPQNREYFHSYGVYEMDAAIDEAEAKGLTAKDDETQWVFCMPIVCLIDTNLDVSKLPPKSVVLHYIPDDLILSDADVEAIQRKEKR